mgnify:CR=1 FL=1
MVIETALLSKTQNRYETEPETLKELRKKSVAVASGKGGVGKSTTALNLAVYFAKTGMKVGLLDMDPLSNIATILDLEISGTFPEETEASYDTIPLSGCIQPVFTNLDLLFPRPKFRKGESLHLLSHVFTQYSEELNNRYDLFLYDLPAGVGQEENLTLLSYVDHLIVVTNAEPTAHVSAGGYIKAVLETAPHVRLYFWHNKYSLVQENGFNPLQVIENYNRQVPPELRIDRTKLPGLKDIAFIPHDPSLDLLQSNLSLEGSVLLKLLETFEVLQKKLLAEVPDALSLDENGKNLIKHYIASLRKLPPTPELAQQIEEYYGSFYRNTSTPRIGKFLARKKLGEFSASFKKELLTYLEQVRNLTVRNQVLSVVPLLEESVESLKDKGRLFAVSASKSSIGRIHQKLVTLLSEAGTQRNLDPFDKNLLSIILFYFALFKLISSPSIQNLFFTFIPKRKNSRGVWVRDKNKQIHYLVEKDTEYHRQYFLLIKKVFPVVLKQLAALVQSYPRLGTWILKDRDGSVNRTAYLKLLTNFIHDAIHAGLGVFIGFKFNTASEAIKQGARNLLTELDLQGSSPQDAEQVAESS